MKKKSNYIEKRKLHLYEKMKLAYRKIENIRIQNEKMANSKRTN